MGTLLRSHFKLLVVVFGMLLAIPAIALRTALEQASLEEGVLSVPWPCETRALVESIEAALRGAPAPADLCRATGKG